MTDNKVSIPDVWYQYATGSYTESLLRELAPEQILTHVSATVLSIADVAKDLGVSVTTVRTMFTDPRDLPLRTATLGGVFEPIALGGFRTSDRQAPGASAHVITKRMLAQFYDPGTFPIKASGSECFQILTLAEAAREYAVSVSQLRRAIAGGRLPAKKVNLWIVLAYDVLKFIAERKTPRARALFTDNQVVLMRIWRQDQKMTLPQVQEKAHVDFGIRADISSISRLLSGDTYSHITEV